MFNIQKCNVRRCSISEFNNILKKVKKDKVKLWRFEDANNKDICNDIFLWFNISKCYLVYNDYTYNRLTKKYNVITRCYETDLNDQYEDGYLEYMHSVSNHCSAIGRAVKDEIPRLINSKEEALVNASGILYSNKKLNHNKVYCYEYDMHLAWLTTFKTCPLPDTTKPMRTNDYVKEGEIGFLTNGYYRWKCGDMVVFKGHYADYIYPIMKCPNLAYFVRLEAAIDKEVNPVKRKDLKARFNEWLGTKQNSNPFVRVAVVAQSNKKILDYIDKYKDKIIFSVTDSLGSTEKIPELEESKDWCLKNEGYLYMDSLNRLYLDKENCITNSVIRGLPKQYIKGLYLDSYENCISAIRDPSKNLYKIDFEKKEIVENHGEK